MTTKYEYSWDETPPFPTIEAEPSDPFTGKSRGPLTAKIDTGASITVIPRSLARELELYPFDKRLVWGFRGTPSVELTFPVDITVEGHVVEFVEVILDEEGDFLLGRDVLNQLVLVLNGPSLIVEVLEP